MKISINLLASRLDRGEGKTSVSDPAMMAILASLTAEVKGLRESNYTNQGRTTATTEVRRDSRDNMGLIVGAAAMLIALGALFLKSSGLH